MLGSKVRRRVVLQKMHHTTSSPSVLMELSRRSLFTAGTTSHLWPSIELLLQRRLRRSGAGERRGRKTVTFMGKNEEEKRGFVIVMEKKNVKS